MIEDKQTIASKIARLQSRLKEIDDEREDILKELESLQQKLSIVDPFTPLSTSAINAQSTLHEKISLFCTLFKGRDDVYPKLWVSKKTGAKGYSPVCNNEWISNICRKPALKCGDCDNRMLSPLTDNVIKKHLDGNITIGIYPMLQDETCYFLAIDFDKKTWQEDVKAFMSACRQNNIPASLERSRSGNGGHVWIFFSEPVSAALARQMGTFLITETMNQRHQLDMKSYDRLFPNQDTMPKGGFGNLIALPLQKIPMEKGNSIFIDENLNPYPDQWMYLSTIRRMSLNEVQTFIDEAIKTKDIIGVYASLEETPPWERTVSFKKTFKKLSCDLPEKVSIILANRLYIRKANLPSQLLANIKRLAAFQNPEFYKKQRLRFSTALIPRIICCAEDIEEYLTIPRGCLDDLKDILSANNISFELDDRRFNGNSCKFYFTGKLTDEQDKAYNKILRYETGILVASPGIGKTIIGIRLISARKTNTLILVHRKPLLEQWRTQIASFLDTPIKEIGQIGGGKDKATALIDVAMIQSLDKKGEVDIRIKNYGHIIVDECHHISAVSFERVMMAANARYITGLTATPYRRDGHQPIITMQCGPIRYRGKIQQTAEPPFKQKLITRTTNFSCAWSEEDTINSIWPLVIRNEERNQMICDDVIENLKEKR